MKKIHKSRSQDNPGILSWIPAQRPFKREEVIYLTVGGAEAVKDQVTQNIHISHPSPNFRKEAI